MQQRRIVVTGLGIIGACGTGAAAVWESIRQGASGLRPLSLFSSIRYERILVGEVPADVDRLAGDVRGSRSDKLAWIAAREAVASAGLPLVGRDSEHGSLAGRRGVVLGATVGGMLGTEKFVRDLLQPRRASYGVLRFHECAASADLIARQFGAGGPVLAFSTACSGGALAIAAAAELIANDEADVVLAGGCDSLCRLTLNGFGSLLLLDPKGCRPFDAQRAGISLGEGAAVLVLEAAEIAAARGGTVLAELSGWGATCDAYHATAPQPDGDGALVAMRRALTRAKLSPTDVSYVNAHGTGTRDNDLMEGRALRRLFGDAPPPVSSTKPFFGHTLGASGAIKAVVSVLALRHQALPPNPGFDTVDPEIGIEPVRAYRPAALTHVMSNSFGFGGNNVVLVFSKPPAVVGQAPRLPSPGQRQPERLPYNFRFPIVGAGAVNPVGETTCEMRAPLPAGRAQVFACGEFGAEKELLAARRRRLSRLQQMTLVAARRCLPAQFDPALACVAIGTGLGSLNEAAAFVENLWRKDEREPLPQRFTNSVHNALAGQVAIELGVRGLNSTPTCHEISFETALWHALRELAAGTANLALAGAADELNPYAVAVGRRWGLPVPGEGAAVFALTGDAPSTPPLAYCDGVRTGRRTRDVAAEARWIADTVDLAKLDVLLTGANGWPSLDAEYAAVAEALGRMAGRKIVVGTYKQWCGEHYSASAFGFSVAIQLVRGEVRLAEQTGDCRLVALYTLSPHAQKALCVVGS